MAFPLRPRGKRPACGYTGSVRAMFLIYVVFIVAALAFFIVLGARG